MFRGNWVVLAIVFSWIWISGLHGVEGGLAPLPTESQYPEDGYPIVGWGSQVVVGPWQLEGIVAIAAGVTHSLGLGYPRFRLLPQVSLTAGLVEDIGDSRVGVYPNPFSSSVRVVFGEKGAGAGEVVIFDVRGRVVREIDLGDLAGVSEIEWDGRDGGGRVVSSGVYFCRISGDGWSEVRRLVFLR